MKWFFDEKFSYFDLVVFSIIVQVVTSIISHLNWG